MKPFVSTRKNLSNAKKISFSMCVIATIIFAITPSVLAQRQETVTPVRDQQVEADVIQPPNNSQQPGRNDTFGSGSNSELEYECHDYVCTCTIGADCREMFKTLSVNDCRDGAPGELECSVDPRD